MIATTLIEIAGVLIVLFTLREVFHDIFHPTRSGSISDLIGRALSSALRHTRLRPEVGPLALVSVILSWFVLLAIGFTLIYFPLIPAQISTGIANPGTGDKLLRSLSWSVGALDTFQTFDMHVKRSGMQLAVASEGLLGISMITASVSWLVLLYPALERTRFLTMRTFVLMRAMEASGASRIDNAVLVTDMADRVIQARIDLILFPMLLNFYPSDPSLTLARALPHLQRTAEEDSDAGCSPELRLAAAQLREALTDFCIMLSERVLSSNPENMEASFREFAARTD